MASRAMLGHAQTLGLGNSIYPGRVGSPPGWDLVVWE